MLIADLYLIKLSVEYRFLSMNQPGIEPKFPGLQVNTLPTKPKQIT